MTFKGRLGEAFEDMMKYRKSVGYATAAYNPQII